MTHNTTTVRISPQNKYMVEHFVFANFKEKNQSIDDPYFNDLMTFLLQDYFKIYYPKLKSESEQKCNP